MIKKSICLLLMALGLSPILQAQDSLLYGIFPLKNGKVVFEKNITVDSVSRDELFSRGMNWATHVYKPQKDSSQIEDKAQGLLMYNGSVNVFFTEPNRRAKVEWNCWHTIKISCKNNQAQIVLTDFEQRVPSGYGNLSSTKFEALKSKTDSLPKSVFSEKIIR